MISFLSNIPIDRTSFWVGFVAGALFIWFVSRLRFLVPRGIQLIRQQIQTTKESLTESVESRFRNESLNWAQHQHLAASLFSLDEILITPHVMAPPAISATGEESFLQNSALLTIPYMPDWPEMSALFGSPTITLPQALEGNANLLLVGTPGSGKTVALAYLTSLLCRHDPEAASLSEFVPVFIHAADLLAKLDGKGFTDVLTGAVSSYSSPFTTARLSKLFLNLLSEKRMLLLVDGIDELDEVTTLKIKEFIGNLLQEYPTLRLVIAASLENYYGLNQLGLVPVGIASWSQDERDALRQKWSTNWLRYVGLNDPQEAEPLEPILLNNWLTTRDAASSPLELTLKLWGAFAGDMLGLELPQLIETHLRRLTTDIPNANLALERLAAQMVMNNQPIVHMREAESWVSEFDKLLEGLPGEADGDQTTKQSKSSEKIGPTSEILKRLCANGLLLNHAGSTITLLHPVFTGYLASRNLATTHTAAILLDKASWVGQYQTLTFWGCFGDVTPAVDYLINQLTQPPLYQGILHIIRWMQVTPKDLPWRSQVMRNVNTIMQREKETAGIIARLISGLALARDPSVIPFFRQLLKSTWPQLRQFGALGCGMIFDTKSVNELSAVLEDENPNAARAACLALVAIGGKTAMDLVVSTLLHGSEAMRRAAAEALANDAKEGHPILFEGINMEDLLVRRASIFGLTCIASSDAISQLEKLEIEDAQWVVRTAAGQALEELRSAKPQIPRPLPGLTESPWLITFAGKQGEGVSPGKPALDMLMRVLTSGDYSERLNALAFLNQSGDENFIQPIYQLYYGSAGEIHEAALNTIWHLSISGIKMPSPKQFGYS